MASSTDIYNQIQGLMGTINPMLQAQPGVSDYFTNGLNKAFDYNKGALQNASQQEALLYSMPGTLMKQYDADFGGTAGVDSNTRINNILSGLGAQTGLVNTAKGLATQAGTNINSLAGKLSDQYGLQISGLQGQLSPLMSIWDRMYSEEQANKRQGSANAIADKTAQLQAIIDAFGNGNNTDTQTNTNNGINASPNSVLPSPLQTTQQYIASKNPANNIIPSQTSSGYFDYLVNKMGGQNNLKPKTL